MKNGAVLLFVLSKINFTLSVSLDEKCKQNRTLRLYFWQQQPYVYSSGSFQHLTDLNGIFPTVLQESLKYCCHATTRTELVEVKAGRAGLKDLLDREDFDIVAPVYGLPSTRNIRGYPFIGVVGSAGVAILMSANASGSKLLLSVLQVWPILVFIIVSAILAGVLMWVLERKENSLQFTDSFSSGIFEGFWWAFCTMTTVGYGDKAPKSMLGKFVASVWMLVGVIIITIFISIITTALTSASYDQYSSIRGMKVSVVNQSMEHQLAIRNNAEIDVLPDQETAFNHVINRHVEISLLDTHALKYHISYLTRKHVVVASVITNHVSYGILLSRNASGLESCLRDFMDVKENWRFELLRAAVGSKRVHVTPGEDYFGSGGIFSITVYSGLALFVVLFVVGLIWEYYSSRKRNKAKLTEKPQPRLEIYRSSKSANEGILRNGSCKAQPSTTPSSTYSKQTTRTQYGGSTRTQYGSSTPRHITILEKPYPPQTSYGNTPWEKLITRQKMELMKLESEFYVFHKDWEKRYREFQRKQKMDRLGASHKEYRNGGQTAHLGDTAF